VILVVYWYAWAKNNFKGPKAAAEEDLRRIEADFAAAAKGHGD
jgi:hypothetical protein